MTESTSPRATKTAPAPTEREPLASRHFGHLWGHTHTTKPTTRSGRMSEIRAIAHFMRPYRRLAALAWGGALMRSVLLCLVPIITKQAIDNGIATGNVQYLAIMCALGVLVLFFAWAGIVARAGFGWQLGDHVTVDLQAEIFAHFQTLSTPQINRVGASAIISRVVNDAPAIRNLFQLGVVAALRNSAQVIITLIFMLWLDLPLTLLSLLVLPLMWLATWWYKRAVRPHYALTRKTLEQVTAAAHDSFTVMRLVHGYSQEEKQSATFHEANLINRNSQVKPNYYFSIFNPVTTVIASISSAILIIFGGIQAIDGAIQIGTIVAFVGLASSFYSSAAALSGTAAVYAQGMAAVDECFDFLAITTDLDEPVDPIPMPTGVQEIVADDLTHKNPYDPGHSAHNVSLTIPAGSHLAFFGEIGSGRSIACRAISRLIPSDGGTVTYGGIDISQLDLREYHKRICYVAPEPYLFAGTIAENLRFANSTVSDDDMIALITTIAGEGFLETFSDGINSIVDIDAANLSSGQVALLGLIRGLLLDPDVLIMDGCMDRFPATIIHGVLEHVESVAQSSTMIVTTQRTEIARETDYIYVFDDGKIVEQGSYDELVQANGRLAQIVQAEAAAAARRPTSRQEVNERPAGS